MNDKVLDNKFRSMLENLIFYDIPKAGNVHVQSGVAQMEPQAERCESSSLFRKT